MLSNRLQLGLGRRCWFAAFMVAVCGLPSVACGEGQSGVLRVLCYNIHYGQGNDGRYDIERLAAVIEQAKPDLVALQEVDVGVKRSGRVHQARRLGELTGMAVRFGPTQTMKEGCTETPF